MSARSPSSHHHLCWASCHIEEAAADIPAEGELAADIGIAEEVDIELVVRTEAAAGKVAAGSAGGSPAAVQYPAVLPDNTRPLPLHAAVDCTPCFVSYQTRVFVRPSSVVLQKSILPPKVNMR